MSEETTINERPSLVEGNIKDTFDFDALTLPQNFAEQVGVKKLLTTVDVKRPHKQTFVRVHPVETYRRNVGLIHLEEDGNFYAVAPNLIGELGDVMVPVTVFTAVTRQGTVFLWPVPLPGADGKSHGSWDSQRMAAERATRQWLRIQWNKEAGAYDVFLAPNLNEEPAWPDMAFNELLKLAFRGRLIDSTDHLVIRKLKGLA